MRISILGRGIELFSFLLGYLAGLAEATTAYLTGKTPEGYLAGVRKAHMSWMPSDFPVD